MTTNNQASKNSPLGQFFGNRKLYTALMRESFYQGDPRNPSSREPNWEQVAAGPPLADSDEVLALLVREGYVGLYARLPGTTIEIPADHDARRGPMLVPSPYAYPR